MPNRVYTPPSLAGPLGDPSNILSQSPSGCVGAEQKTMYKSLFVALQPQQRDE